MSDTDPTTVLHNFRRKRTRERRNATRFTTEINSFNEDTTLDDCEYYRDRLQETLTKLTSLDDAIHDLLPDDEYDSDVEKSDEYLDCAKRAIQKASKRIESKISTLTANTTLSDVPLAAISLPVSAPHSVRLPPIKLEPFGGDVETWARFWEQFESSIDKDPSLSTINKHIFLRGYLESEPKQLVEGIAVIADTYEETKKILQARYGDKNRIIQAHLDYLEDVRPIRIATPEALNTTYIECHRRVQALRSLGEDVNGYGRMLAPKILRAFPEDICRRWIVHVRREKISEGDILKLMEFLGEEVDSALITQKIRGDSISHVNIPTTATLRVDSKSEKRRRNKGQTEPYCVFCEFRGHWAQDCRKITNVNERRTSLRNANRCFLCLNRGHFAKDCSKRGNASCLHCKAAHHRSICSDQKTTEPRTNSTTFTSVNRIENSTDFTYLQTARVWITGPTGLTKLTRCVLDGGSQSSFITTSLAKVLKLEAIDSRDLVIGAFETPPTAPTPRRMVKLSMKSIWTNTNVNITAFESAHAFSSQPAVPHDIKKLLHTRKLQLADPKDNNEETLPIEILIGGDHYWKIAKDASPIRISPSLVFIPSNFGWILSGNQSGVSVNHTTINLINLQHSHSMCDDSLRSFWDLEAIGITPEQDRSKSTKDSALLEEFHASYCIEDHRRVVRLPKRSTAPLPSNICTAEKRFDALERRLQKNEAFRLAYENQMLDYIKKGHVELAPQQESANTFYLPHHLVKKDKRGHVKWRIVFDGSSHERNAPSLNETLEMGPNLLPETLAILMRFRLHPFAMIADISQAFLQLVLHREDRDLTRFFWYRIIENEVENPITSRERAVYRFTRLPFGLTCSPFLLSATIRELAVTHQLHFPIAASLVDDNTFMDDFVSGAEDNNTVVALYYELTSLMRQIQLPLGKWATNSSQLTDIWTAEGRDITHDAHVLGVAWCTKTDTFSLAQQEVTDKLTTAIATKRTLLQATASFYDPLGLVSPVSIVGKILFQDTWTRGITWDEILPNDLATRWRAWLSTLPGLQHIAISRWIGTSEDDHPQIHVFCDASERSYGAALYIRHTSNNHREVHLICSRSRLAPVKRVTLPRLELLAALMGARLLKYYFKATNSNITETTLWSDSSVTLGWIRSDPSRWKTFVCNRVTEIQDSTSPSQWRHCPGKDNPADLLSRGTTPENLKAQEVWWSGPAWLSEQPSQWPTDLKNISESTLLHEVRRSNPQVLLIDTPERVIDVRRFSSYWRLLRVTAHILRLKRKLLHKEHSTGEFTAREMTTARDLWIGTMQEDCFPADRKALREHRPLPDGSKIRDFNPFLEDGLIRLGGRLQYAELSQGQRHPLIMDGNHPFTELLIRQTHIRLHHLGVRIVLSELRTSFWILRARQAIKRVINRCLPCKMARNVSGQEIEAPLPADRVTPQRPFAVTGIDFAGPLYAKARYETKKCYIVLFTCATTRALHLELSTAMTTDRFLLALQRFAGRRGIPHTIYSDNARTFHAANKEMTELWTAVSSPQTQQFLSQQGTNWKFIAPRAAWWGGWWERMVGSVKRCLRKVLGRTSMDEEGLQTVLVSIEASLNSRPITQADEDALTPAHFLVGERLTTLPTGPEPKGTMDLTKEFRLRQKSADDFWRRWSKEYLMLLRSFHQVRSPQRKSGKIRVGDVVLLQEDGLRRHMWKKARVTDVREGRDGLVRTVILTMPDGKEVARPIQLVIPLEVDQGGEDVEECLPCNSH